MSKLTAIEAYEATPIGAENWFKAKESAADGDLEKFKAYVAVLDNLATQGRIHIIQKHKESGSGGRHIDMVRFRRLS